MKVFFLAAVTLSVLSVLNAQTVPLILKNPGMLENSNLPLSFGVPFPEGTVKSDFRFSLKDGSGKTIPLQTEVTGTWEDGSIKWLLCDAQVAPEKKSETNFTLEYGKDIKPVKPPMSLTVKELEKPVASYEINTGAMIFRVKKDGFNLIDSVVPVGSEKTPIIQNTTGCGLNITDGDGKLFSSSFGAPDEIKVEEAGPLRAVICAKGWYFSREQEKFCRYIVRLHFFAGQKYVKILHTFIITESTDKARFQDIAIKLNAGVQSYVFGGMDDKKQLSAKDGGAHLLQYDSDKFIVRKDSEKTEWTDKADGEKAAGWLAAKSEAGSLLLFAKNFWQEFPKEMEVDAKGALIFHEWPAHGIAMPERKVENNMLQHLWFCHEGKTLDFKFPDAYLKYRSPEYSEYEYRYFASAKDANCIGIAKTHEVYLAFGKKEESENLKKLLAAWQAPAFCLATPDYMCASGVFGRLHPYDPARFGKIEEALSKAFDAEQRIQDYTKDYGMFIYGDAHTCWDYKKGRWMDLYRTWRAFHHGAPRVPWILYARSGDPKYIERGIVNARHLMDIGLCNYTKPELENKPYPQGKILGALNDYKGIVPWHSGSRLMDYNYLTDFMLYYYYMTGDKRGLEVAKMWGESVKEKYTKPFAHREGAGTTSSLIDLYRATHDEELKKIIDKQVKFMLGVQNMKPGISENVEGSMLPYGAFPQWENYAPWLEKYWEMTKDPKAAESIKALADAYISGQGDSFSSYFGGMQVNIPAYAYMVSKDKKYLLYGLRLMNTYLDGIEESPGALMDGFPHAAQISLGFCYASQRIPYFLSALAESKETVTENMAFEELKTFYALPLKQVKEKDKDKIRIFEILLLKEKAGDFSILLNIYNKYPKPVIDYSVISPSGKELIKKSEEFRGIMFTLNLTCPEDGEKGIYKVLVSSKGSYWEVGSQVTTKPEMKQALPKDGTMFDTRSDAQYYFFVPAGVSEFELLTSSNGAFFSVIRPDGDEAAKILSVPGKENTVKIKVRPEETSKLWELRGAFNSCTVNFKAKGGVIPPYYYCDKTLFFVPEPLRK